MSIHEVAMRCWLSATMRQFVAGIALAFIAVGVGSSPASARVFFGFGYAPYWAPPTYYPPPAYYVPPPVVYAPPQVYAPPPPAGYRQTCYATPYSCPMDRPTTPGAACYCPGNNGQRVWGRSN